MKNIKKEELKLITWRLRSSYLTSVVSIALVLFMLGLTGLLIINARQLSKYVKENIGLTVVFKNNIKEASIRQLQKELDAQEFVIETHYITKEQAANDLKQELGEDFVKFLGYNPLLSSVELRLNADYANKDSMLVIRKKIERIDAVKAVYYQESLIESVNNNIQKISLVILAFGLLLLIIAIALINNTIRLSIYSKRFFINTMQLVGATRNFIRLPFILKGVLHGVIGAVIAFSLLSGVMLWIKNEIGHIINNDDILILSLIVLILGILIAAVSTNFAVNKYLRIKGNALYY